MHNKKFLPPILCKVDLEDFLEIMAGLNDFADHLILKSRSMLDSVTCGITFSSSLDERQIIECGHMFSVPRSCLSSGTCRGTQTYKSKATFKWV